MLELPIFALVVIVTLVALTSICITNIVRDSKEETRRRRAEEAQRERERVNRSETAYYELFGREPDPFWGQDGTTGLIERVTNIEEALGMEVEAKCR